MRALLEQILKEQQETNKLLKVRGEQSRVNGIIALMETRHEKELDQILQEIEMVVRASSHFDVDYLLDDEGLHWKHTELTEENDDRVSEEVTEIFNTFYPDRPEEYYEEDYEDEEG